MRTPLQGVKHTLGTTTRDRAAVRSTATKAPVGSFLVPRVAAPSIRACLGRHLRLAGRCPNSSSLHRPTGRGRRCCRSQRLGTSTVVAAAAMRKGVFNLTRTGIAAELTAASGGSREPRPETGRRCAFILNTTCHFMDKKPGRGTRSGALLPGFSAFFRRSPA